MQNNTIYVKVAWLSCLGLMTSDEFNAVSRRVRPVQTVAIGSDYMIPAEFAKVHKLEGNYYHVVVNTEKQKSEILDYNGNRYVPTS